MLSTIIIGTVLAVIVISIIVGLYNKKKKGISSCGGGCSGCLGCSCGTTSGSDNYVSDESDVHQSNVNNAHVSIS